MRLLLTGFEPFGGDSINPSEQIVRYLAAVGLPGIVLATAILPVDRQAGPERLLLALEQHEPEVVVCLGVAAGRAEINLERVFVNLLDFNIPDNAGNQVQDTPIIAGGPAAYFSTLPVRAMLADLQDAGIPARISLTAGAYLCNQVSYVLLHELARQEKPIPAGFVHLPALPEQAARRPQPLPSMALETQTAGVRIILETVRKFTG